MAVHFRGMLIPSHEGRKPVIMSGRPRRTRRRLTPDAESLEIRSCPSALAPSLLTDRMAHAMVVADRHGHPERPVDLAHDHAAGMAIPLKRSAAGPQTIYVKPGGKSTKGKTANKPMGNFAKATQARQAGGDDRSRTGDLFQN